jgi:hypothetical protein
MLVAKGIGAAARLDISIGGHGPGSRLGRRKFITAVIVRLDRTIQYAAASRFYHQRVWNTGSPAFFAGDDE